MPYFTPEQIWQIVLDSSPALNTIASALSGNKHSQEQLKQGLKDVSRNNAIDILDITADASGVVSDTANDIALGALLVGEPATATGAATVANVAGVAEVGALYGKATLTQTDQDFKDANSAARSLGFSVIIGNAGKLVKNTWNTVSDRVIDIGENILSRIYDYSDKRVTESVEE